MMENIIVTIKYPANNFSCDIEAPTNLDISRLKEDIVETLNHYNWNLSLDSASIGLFCDRIDRLLTDEETLESAGVWNGDYLTIKEVRK